MPCVSYLPHQREAIDKLRSGSILCAGVGTGKSITALGYFHDVECKAVEWSDGKPRGPMTDPKPLYIITTARKRDTKEWESECGKFDLSMVPITIDSWNNLHKYEDVDSAFFIFDEQRVVGSGAWVKSFLKIARVNHWILLSATPGDTWMDYIPVFVANGFYRNRTQFLRQHAVYNRYSKYPKVDRWVDTAILERYRRRITVVMSYEKKTVPHFEQVEFDYDRDLYKTISVDRWDPFRKEPIRDISGACYLMRRAASSGMTEGQISYHPFRVNARALDILDKCVMKHPKLIVFYNYDYELEAIKGTFKEMRDHGYSPGLQISLAEWNGHRHEPIPESDHWIYLVQYTAGAEGWNCVETDAMIFYSQSYSYKQMTQAAGRIDRLNTPFEDLYYYTYISKAPIDAAVSRALKLKKTFNEKNFALEAGLDLPEKSQTA